ncbi:cupin domain-containing protein [Streptomyces sp. NA04227]|uniref:helix-turn-helix domain-containing protein n=1 Tax=Streptomyces sp. NA04227 TaxID=2742136 RepID=UPI001590A71A|nr:helix-turn-helix transcriptional regulator [Streptomyces sp. NA04227]QKW08346.1 cupin domain-containing protein [Streptomyces sp. NA04227]
MPRNREVQGAKGAEPDGPRAREDDGADLAEVLSSVGPRLRALRKDRGTTLVQLSERTGISLSTLSRLESGQRRPTLELLLPLAKAHGVQLDEMVGAPATGDPRIHPRPFTRHGQTFIPLTRYLGGLHAYKQILPAPPSGTLATPPEQRVHEGYEWLYVLSGRLRLLLGEHDLILTAGEAAEFDTRTPHAFTNAGDTPVEFLSLFGPQGERLHVRARTTEN